MNILSIQSHVSYGYVGNKAATFPLQALESKYGQSIRYNFPIIPAMVIDRGISALLNLKIIGNDYKQAAPNYVMLHQIE
jgi:hypothetical protein